MRKILALIMVLGVVAVYSMGRAEEEKKAKSTTLTGILVDTKCYMEDGEKGNDHGTMKACGTSCLKDGSPAGLLVGKKLYILIFPAPTFADYVGKMVEVTGELRQGNLIPEKAFVVEGGKKKAIKMAGAAMM